MARAAAAGRATKSEPSRGRRKTNPHAEWVTADELRHLVSTFYGTKTIMFDRELAETLLEMNTGNRKINQRKRATWARQMVAGEFENTGEPIIVAREGILNSGQHRLWGVVDADALIDLDVRFGIPRRLFTKTDTGVTRSPADVMTINGVENGRQVSATVRMLILYERGLPDAIREFVSNDEVHTAFIRWRDVDAVVERVIECGAPAGIRSTPLYVAAYLAAHSPGRSRLDAWLETLATGEGTGRDDPALQLRERLLRGIEAPIGTREGQLERLALMIKSWNLYRKGETLPMREFRWRGTGDDPEPFPVVPGLKLPQEA